MSRIESRQDMKIIIPLIVLIISAIAYFFMRKYQRKDTIINAIKLKSELGKKLSEIRVLQTHLVPIYGSEKVLRLISGESAADYNELLKAAEDFNNQIISCEKLDVLLKESDEDSFDTADLQEMLIRIEETIRDYRYKLNHFPPEVRNVLKGEK